ncbi:hypothetical protein U9R62_02615 [Cylindrospermopsis raciborskii DSH]|uniref:hypothetical protein n=1 Tax=Cylindrospermopsis raciborskii TaxID=77022 RepID=UPI002EDAB584
MNVKNILTQIPGFSDPVPDAQQDFRALLCADATRKNLKNRCDLKALARPSSARGFSKRN